MAGALGCVGTSHGTTPSPRCSRPRPPTRFKLFRQPYRQPRPISHTLSDHCLLPAFADKRGRDGLLMRWNRWLPSTRSKELIVRGSKTEGLR